MNKRLQKPLQMKTTLFNFSIIISTASFVLLMVFLLLDQFNMIEIKNKEVIAQLASGMVLALYSFWFSAKQFVTFRKREKVKFIDFSGVFIFILAFPIGVWFIQPELNKLNTKEV